jgi:hypothetical protein
MESAEHTCNDGQKSVHVCDKYWTRQTKQAQQACRVACHVPSFLVTTIEFVPGKRNPPPWTARKSVRSKEFVSLPVTSGECSPRCIFYRWPGYLVPACQPSGFWRFRIIFCFLAACFCLFSDLGKFHHLEGNAPECAFLLVSACLRLFSDLGKFHPKDNAHGCVSVLVSACFRLFSDLGKFHLKDNAHGCVSVLVSACFRLFYDLGKNRMCVRACFSLFLLVS